MKRAFMSQKLSNLPVYESSKKPSGEHLEKYLNPHYSEKRRMEIKSKFQGKSVFRFLVKQDNKRTRFRPEDLRDMNY